MGVKAWLQLMRAHTAPASILLLTVPFLLGGGKLFSPFGFSVVFLAWASHLTSFAHNSVMDTQGGWDLRDAHKTHHPLVQGIISLKTAHNIIHPLLFLTTIFAVFLVLCSAGNKLYALICLLVWIVAGHSYNDGMGKTLLPSFIPISICMTSLSLYGYFLAAEQLSGVMVWTAVYVFFTLWFQTSVEGNLKEIKAEEENLLAWMGAQVDSQFEPGYGETFHPGWAKAYAFIVKGVGIAVAVVIAVLVRFPFFLFVCLGMWYVMTKLVEERVWNRDKTLLYCALEEIFTIYLLCLLLLPMVGYMEGLVLMVGGLVYFYLFNRVEWHTGFTPKV